MQKKKTLIWASEKNISSEAKRKFLYVYFIQFIIFYHLSFEAICYGITETIISLKRDSQRLFIQIIYDQLSVIILITMR